MVPYIQDRFQLPRWEMELFSLPKRLRGKGQEEIAFATFDWTAYGDSPIVSSSNICRRSAITYGGRDGESPLPMISSMPIIRLPAG